MFILIVLMWAYRACCGQPVTL